MKKLSEEAFVPRVSEHTGDVYGKLTVLTEYTVRDTRGKTKKWFNCVCSCGNNYSATKFACQHGVTTSCGCGKREKYDAKYTKAKVGDVFNFLTVVSTPLVTSAGRRADFMCECGVVKSILVDNVVSGDTKSCGCYNKKHKEGFKDKPLTFKLHRDKWATVSVRYINGETVAQIASSEGVGEDTIYRAMKLSGVESDSKEDRSLRGKEVVIDRTRFSDYSCNDTAYYCGLLLADGCITGRTGNTLAFSLKSEDAYMVDSLHSWLSAPTKLRDTAQYDARTDKTYYARAFRVTDHVVVANLRKLGFEERKSTREKLPSIYSDNAHFWRGMVDGDGHIGKTSWMMGLCGSLEICEGFSRYATNLGVLSTPHISLAGKLYSVSITNKKDVKIVLDALYNDATLFLKRKHNVYETRYNK